jgi:hypothetical protein
VLLIVLDDGAQNLMFNGTSIRASFFLLVMSVYLASNTPSALLLRSVDLVSNVIPSTPPPFPNLDCLTPFFAAFYTHFLGPAPAPRCSEVPDAINKRCSASRMRTSSAPSSPPASSRPEHPPAYTHPHAAMELFRFWCRTPAQVYLLFCFCFHLF